MVSPIAYGDDAVEQARLWLEKTTELEAENARLRELVEHERNFKRKYLAEKDRLGDICEKYERLLEECKRSIKGLIGRNLDDPDSWRHVKDETIGESIRLLERIG